MRAIRRLQLGLLASAAFVVATPALAQSSSAASSTAPVAAQPASAPAPTSDDAPQATVYDPLERANRGLFSVHKALDRAVARPVARGYKAVTPKPVRRGVRNVLNNLGEPLTFVNDVLQVKPSRAGQTAARFAMNSTVGVLGVFDVATKAGVPAHYEDFGQTLGRYGVPPGPYVFVPLLGPSNVRDIGGRVADVTLNPVNHLEFENSGAVKTGMYVVNAVDARASGDEELQRLEENATDEYATYRSLYNQNRRAAIADGKSDVDDLPEFEAPPAPPPQQPATPRRRRR